MKNRCMGRTNIVLNDHLVEEGLKVTGLRTKRELVDLALRELLRKEDQKGILSLAGKIHWQGDLNSIRKDRFAHSAGGGQDHPTSSDQTPQADDDR